MTAAACPGGDLDAGGGELEICQGVPSCIGSAGD